MTRKHLTIFLFYVLKTILITETSGQAWLLHHRHFNQYQPEHFKKKRLELKSVSLLKKKKKKKMAARLPEQQGSLVMCQEPDEARLDCMREKGNRYSAVKRLFPSPLYKAS